MPAGTSITALKSLLWCGTGFTSGLTADAAARQPRTRSVRPARCRPSNRVTLISRMPSSAMLDRSPQAPTVEHQPRLRSSGVGVLGDTGRRIDTPEVGMTSEDRQPASASIAPWLSVADGGAAVEFYRAAFGAVERERLEDAGRVVVAQLAIGGADVWVQEDPEGDPHALGERSPVRMILTVDDPDAVFARAVAAGALQVAPVHEDHGWLVGRIADPSGHHWEIGRRLDS
jgi:PhnB protein